MTNSLLWVNGSLFRYIDKTNGIILLFFRAQNLLSRIAGHFSWFSWLWCRMMRMNWLFDLNFPNDKNTMRTNKKKYWPQETSFIIKCLSLMENPKKTSAIAVNSNFYTYLPRQSGEYVIVRKTHKYLSISKRRSLAS